MQLKIWKKQEETKSKFSRWEEIIKAREKINEREITITT